MASDPPAVKPKFRLIAACLALFRRYHHSKIGRAIDRRVLDLRNGWLDARIRSQLAGCGDRSTLEFPLVIKGAGHVRIGQDSTLNSFIHIWGHGGVTIGDRVLIASHTAVTSITHDYTAETIFGTVEAKPVVIEDDVWIGAGAKILPGVTVRRGAVVGAGAVVTRDVPAFAIVVGVPAKVVRYRPGHELSQQKTPALPGQSVDSDS